MKILKWISLLVLLTLTLTLAACAPSAGGLSDTATQPANTPAGEPTAAPTPAPATAGPKGGAEPQAALVARQTLAQQLGVSPQDIQIVKAEKTDWPDSCLGIQVQGVVCAQVIVPGYLVVLEHAGKQYSFHTDETGGDVRSAEAPEPQAGEAAITWHREGGIAGFCDDLVVYVSGYASASSCKGGQSTPSGQGNLTADQLSQLHSWVNSMKSFTVDQKDPAIADAMSIHMVFQGRGSNEPTEADKAAILNFASQLYVDLAQAGPASTPTENPQQALNGGHFLVQELPVYLP